LREYIGTKRIKASPMNRLNYNIYRGWELPNDENGSDEGFLVEYLDGGKPNHLDHKGYISWSPKEQFKNAYKISETYIDRLVIEKNDLEDKIEKLKNALDNKKIPTEAVNINEKQLSIMLDYSSILNEKLN